MCARVRHLRWERLRSNRRSSRWRSSLSDSSVFVSAMASDALARIGRSGVPILIERLRNGIGLERARAAKALLAILDSRSIPALIAALDDDSPVVQHYASEALTRLGVGTVLIKPL